MINIPKPGQYGQMPNGAIIFCRQMTIEKDTDGTFKGTIELDFYKVINPQRDFTQPAQEKQAQEAPPIEIETKQPTILLLQ